MPRKFVKMQGTGNDYIFFDCRREEFPEPSRYAKQLSDRRFGIGGDGIVLLLPSARADVRMRMFNADGSEGKMCGNAVRCIGRLLNAESGRSRFSVETLAGVKEVSVGDGITVNMGKADFSPQALPTLLKETLEVPLCGYTVTCVSMGNPHCVVFADPASFDLQTAALRLGESGMFPEGVNVEVAQVSGDEIRMRVFERGSGETLSCGTGACAVAAAAEAVGRVAHGAEHTMRLPGGRLQTKTTAEGILLTGEAEAVFTGAINL